MALISSRWRVFWPPRIPVRRCFSRALIAPLERSTTRRELRGEVTAGRLDARAVEAVLGSAGANPRQKMVFNPGGLTDREIEVLQLMARGQANREMARVLGITPKTVSHHVQHIYNKIGVSTRAAAAVFAVENRLL